MRLRPLVVGWISFGVCLFGAATPTVVVAEARGSATLPQPSKTVEQVFDEIVERLGAEVEAAKVKINRATDTAVTRIERSASRGVQRPALERSADRAKGSVRAAARSGLAKLNREVGRGMFKLRRHPDYERDYQDRLDFAFEEAIERLRVAVEEASNRLDAAVTAAPVPV